MEALEALLPRRKEPFSREMIVKLLTIEDGTALGKGKRAAPAADATGADAPAVQLQSELPKGASKVERDSLLWGNIFALIATLAQCGFRKAEVTVADGEEFGLRNLSWIGFTIGSRC